MRCSVTHGHFSKLERGPVLHKLGNSCAFLFDKQQAQSTCEVPSDASALHLKLKMPKSTLHAPVHLPQTRASRLSRQLTRKLAESGQESAQQASVIQIESNNPRTALSWRKRQDALEIPKRQNNHMMHQLVVISWHCYIAMVADWGHDSDVLDIRSEVAGAQTPPVMAVFQLSE